MTGARLAVIAAAVLAGLAAAFAFGVGVGVYRWPPYAALQTAHQRLDRKAPVVPYDRERESLAGAFSDSLVPGQIYPPSTTVAAVSDRVSELFLDFASFGTAYANVAIRTPSRTDQRTLRLTYQLGRTYTALAYFVPGPQGRDGGHSPCAVLIIPGSGRNQSSMILEHEPSYGNIDRVAARYCDTFVFIKPNEDIAAIHDGTKKLSFHAITNYLLNKGGSYSARYIADTLAITKYLQQEYAKTIVAGLSQGGSAALLNALQSKPAAAIVASGYSVLDSTISLANDDQIAIPGVYRDFEKTLASAVKASPTRYLFTYGKQEVGSYKIEAEEGPTCRLLQPAPNVVCRAHDGGHMFPEQVVDEFLSAILHDQAR